MPFSALEVRVRESPFWVPLHFLPWLLGIDKATNLISTSPKILLGDPITAPLPLTSAHFSTLGEVTSILRLEVKSWCEGKAWMHPTLGNSTLCEKKKFTQKKGEIHALQVSRWTHTVNHQLYGASYHYKNQFFMWGKLLSWVFSTWPSHLNLCVATIFSWTNQRTVDALMKIWLSTAFKSSSYYIPKQSSNEGSYCKSIVVLLAFASVRSKLFPCELMDRNHIYYLKNVMKDTLVKFHSQNFSHLLDQCVKKAERGEKKKNRKSMPVKDYRWPSCPDVILLMQSKFIPWCHFIAQQHLLITTI